MTKMAIYGLHLGDFSIRYVGQTRMGVYQRLHCHRSYARRPDPVTPVYRWMAKHGPGSVYAVVLRIPANQQEMDEWETHEIASRTGLLNVEAGGLRGQRLPSSRRPQKMCRRGLHELAGENVVTSGSYRRCRPCAQARERSRVRPASPKVRDDPAWIDPRCILSAQQQAAALERLRGGATMAQVARDLSVGHHVIRKLATRR